MKLIAVLSIIFSLSSFACTKNENMIGVINSYQQHKVYIKESNTFVTRYIITEDVADEHTAVYLFYFPNGTCYSSSVTRMIVPNKKAKKFIKKYRRVR